MWIKIEEWFGQEFPEDVITEIKKGARGGCILVMLRTMLQAKCVLKVKERKIFRIHGSIRWKKMQKICCMIVAIITDVISKIM